GGTMTTDLLSLSQLAAVADAIDGLREFDGGTESLSGLCLGDRDEKLVGTVPLASIVLADADTPLASLGTDDVISCPERASEPEFSETFDKYNLLILPVVDEDNKLVGIITADDVIAMLRRKQ